MGTYDAFGGYGPHEFEITESGLAELHLHNTMSTAAN